MKYDEMWWNVMKCDEIMKYDEIWSTQQDADASMKIWSRNRDQGSGIWTAMDGGKLW